MFHPKSIVLPFIFHCLSGSVIQAQQASGDQLADIIYLDSIVVQATKSDFSVADFIDLVRKDQSFYLAFRNLRFANYLMQTEMEFFDKRHAVKASYSARHTQSYDGKCRWMTIQSQKESGSFRKGKNRYRFYTTELFDRLFVTNDTVCSSISLDQPLTISSTSGREGHISELKKIIFAPGSPSNVPFIGKKSEIFSEKMWSRYDFSISSASFEGRDAYVFEASIKPEYEKRRKFNQTLVKSLITYFSKGDFQVLGRKYRIAQHAVLYQFDVTMDIKLAQHEGSYFPTKIAYQGFWNIPTKKKEQGRFEIYITNFESVNSTR